MPLVEFLFPGQVDRMSDGTKTIVDGIKIAPADNYIIEGTDFCRGFGTADIS